MASEVLHAPRRTTGHEETIVGCASNSVDSLGSRLQSIKWAGGYRLNRIAHSDLEVDIWLGCIPAKRVVRD